MPVQTALIEIPFTGGVDESPRKENIAPGTFTTLKNLRMVKRGSYQKRYGFAAVGLLDYAGAAIPNGDRIIGYKDELCLIDEETLYTRSATANRWRQVEGYAPRVEISSQPVAALQYGAVSYDAAQLNGYTVLSWVLPAGGGLSNSFCIFASVVDSASGVTVSPPVAILGGTAGLLVSVAYPQISLVTAGTRVILVYAVDGSQGGDIWTSYIDVTSAATIDTGWSVPAATITDARAVSNSSNVFDACTLGSNLIGIAYTNDLGTGQGVTVRTFNSSIVQQATTTLTSHFNLDMYPNAVGIDGSDADVVFVAYAYNQSVDIRVIGLDPSTLSVTGTATAVLALGSGGEERCVNVTRTGTQAGTLIVSDLNSDTRSRNFTITAGAVAPSGTTLLNYNMWLSHRPFTVDGRWYCGFQDRANRDDPQQIYLIDLTATQADQVTGTSVGFLRYAGSLTPRLSYLKPEGSSNLLPHTALVSSTKAVMVGASLKNATSSSLDLVTVDWATSNRNQPALIGDAVTLSGSPPSFYDGVRVSEIGFAQRPIVWVALGTSGDLTGAYKYLAVYEQIDARGQWHQSNASDPSGTVTASSDRIVVSVYPLMVTNRMPLTTDTIAVPNQVRIALYRTVDGGNVYYRVPDSETINDPSQDTVDITDNTSDLLLGAPCYFQPGIPNTSQGHVTPPSFSTLIAHGDRIVGVNRKALWFSFQVVDGEGPAFSDLFQISIPSGDDITALASMDGSLVVFKRDRIFFIDGQGPADSGTGGDFSPPQSIATAVGCIEPRSVVVTPDGVMFQSLRGIELLTRSRQVVPFRGLVEDSTNANPVITSAVLDEAQGFVIFTCLPTETSATGITLCWDYLNHVWTTGTLGDGTTANCGAKSAIMWGNNTGTTPVYTWHQSAGGIFQESTTSYLDVGDWVTCTVVTPWMHPAGLVGFVDAVRATLLAERLTGHDLTISVAYNYSDSYTDVRSWTAAELAALATSRQMLEVDFTVKECTAFRMKIEDATPSSGGVSTGQGCVLIGMQVEGANEGIMVPLPEANRQ